MNALERAWYQKSVWLWLLAPLSLLFGIVSLCRRWCFKAGWFFLTSLMCQLLSLVISVLAEMGKRL